MLGKTNIIILVSGLAALVIGYIALSKGPEDNPLSMTIAPLLLVAAYCVVFPIAIIRKEKKDNSAK